MMHVTDTSSKREIVKRPGCQDDASGEGDELQKTVMDGLDNCSAPSGGF
ncbi:hypothetical protein NPIL_528061, partial [Nephila pilipes]